MEMEKIMKLCPLFNDTHQRDILLGIFANTLKTYETRTPENDKAATEDLYKGFRELVSFYTKHEGDTALRAAILNIVDRVSAGNADDSYRMMNYTMNYGWCDIPDTLGQPFIQKIEGLTGRIDPADAPDALLMIVKHRHEADKELARDFFMMADSLAPEKTVEYIQAALVCGTAEMRALIQPEAVARLHDLVAGEKLDSETAMTAMETIIRYGGSDPALRANTFERWMDINQDNRSGLERFADKLKGSLSPEEAGFFTAKIAEAVMAKGGTDKFERADTYQRAAKIAGEGSAAQAEALKKWQEAVLEMKWHDDREILSHYRGTYRDDDGISRRIVEHLIDKNSPATQEAARNIWRKAVDRSPAYEALRITGGVAKHIEQYTRPDDTDGFEKELAQKWGALLRSPELKPRTVFEMATEVVSRYRTPTRVRELQTLEVLLEVAGTLPPQDAEAALCIVALKAPFLSDMIAPAVAQWKEVVTQKLEMKDALDAVTQVQSQASRLRNFGLSCAAATAGRILHRKAEEQSKAAGREFLNHLSGGPG